MTNPDYWLNCKVKLSLFHEFDHVMFVWLGAAPECLVADCERGSSCPLLTGQLSPIPVLPRSTQRSFQLLYPASIVQILPNTDYLDTANKSIFPYPGVNLTFTTVGKIGKQRPYWSSDSMNIYTHSRIAGKMTVTRVYYRGLPALK